MGYPDRVFINRYITGRFKLGMNDGIGKAGVVIVIKVDAVVGACNDYGRWQGIVQWLKGPETCFIVNHADLIILYLVCSPIVGQQ